MPHFHLTLDGRLHEVQLADATVIVDGESFGVQVEGEGRSVRVRVNGKPLSVELLERSGSRLTVRVGDQQYVVDLDRHLMPARQAGVVPVRSSAQDTAGVVSAPMSGRIVRLLVQAGEMVEAGDLLLTLEAMKMENEMHAPRPGLVQRVAVSEGQRVSEGATLLVIE